MEPSKEFLEAKAIYEVAEAAEVKRQQDLFDSEHPGARAKYDEANAAYTKSENETAAKYGAEIEGLPVFHSNLYDPNDQEISF